MKNNFYLSLFFSILLFFSVPSITKAADSDVIQDTSDSGTSQTVTDDTTTNDITPDTPPAPSNPLSFSETVIVRAGDNVLFNGVVAIPEEGTIEALDATGTLHFVPTTSALGLLEAVDAVSDTFSISDLEYYASFGSLYLKCITSSTNQSLCDNWQFVVNGSTPTVGIDKTMLSDGETVGFYFGSPHQLIFPGSTYHAGDTITVTAENYNYEDNTWSPLSGVTVSATTPNASDPYTPTVVSGGITDTEGHASFIVADPGTYDVGILEDYYFPSYPLTVISPQNTAPAPVIISGGGVPLEIIDKKFDPQKAAQFLIQNFDNTETADGELYGDWAIIGLSATDLSPELKQQLRDYLCRTKAVSPLLTDTERHAMAILSLGGDPYTFCGENYIQAILQNFDGSQFGDNSLVNDDIFALIPLLASGYTLKDANIQADTTFILNHQKADGSWEESVDLTSAAVQALYPLETVPEVAVAIQHGVAYIDSFQKENGSFDDSVFSTAWALQSKQIVPNEDSSLTNSLAYFGSLQSDDGGLLQTGESMHQRIWATSYALPATLQKSWITILVPAQRPAEITIDVPKIISQPPADTAQKKHTNQKYSTQTVSVSSKTPKETKSTTPQEKESVKLSATVLASDASRSFSFKRFFQSLVSAILSRVAF